MPAKPVASPDDIELSSIFAALKRSAPRLVLASAVLGGLTFAVLSLVAPKYSSQAELAIVARSSAGSFADSKAASGGSDSVTTKMDKEAINTHVRALQSTDLLTTVADKLGLKNKPEFNPALGPVDTLGGWLRTVGIGAPRPGESVRDSVLDAMRERLQVYSAKESRFITIQSSSIEPQAAADIANALAETYRSSLAEQNVNEIEEQQNVLSGKIDRLIPEVAAAETEVDRYRGEINVFKGGAQNTGLNEQQMSEMTAELTRAKSAQGEAEARARSAREMMKLGSADALPDVQKSPLIQNLVQQRVRIERQISELSATLLPGHPRMQQLNADLAGLKRQISGEIAKVVDSLDKEAKVAQGREESIKTSLDDLKTRIVTNAPEEAKLRQLEANVKAKRTELENLQGQLEANRKKLDARAQPVEAQIISKAQPSSVKDSPKKASLALLVAVATLLFGVAWAITRALFVAARGGSKRIDAEHRPAVSTAVRSEPALATSKVADEAAAPAMAPAMHASKAVSGSVVRNAVETSMASLADRLAHKRPVGGGHRALMTGSVQSLDVRSDAIELATVLASGGAQVLLVEWSPSGSVAEGAAPSRVAGLNELLLGTASFDDVLERLPDSLVHTIRCGSSLSGAEVDPDHLNIMLDAFDEAYDHIVIAGNRKEARGLFEAIQGRFDAAILVLEGHQRISVLDDGPTSFLGFEVSDIDIVQFERQEASKSVADHRIARAIRRSGQDAHPA